MASASILTRKLDQARWQLDAASGALACAYFLFPQPLDISERVISLQMVSKS